MTTQPAKPLNYLQWVALMTLYRLRERPSSPVQYVGGDATVKALIAHHPPFVQWIGHPNDLQVHITIEGIAVCETTHSD